MLWERLSEQWPYAEEDSFRSLAMQGTSSSCRQPSGLSPSSTVHYDFGPRSYTMWKGQWRKPVAIDLSPVERYCSSALGLWVTSADLCNCWLSHHPALLTQGLPGESGIFHRWNPMVLGLAVSQKTTWASRPPGTAYCQTSRSRNSFKEWPKLEQKCNSVEVRCTNCLEKMHCWHLESCKARQNRLMKKLAF